LTVSHVSPLFQPYEVNFNCHSHGTRSRAPNHGAVESLPILPTVAFNKDAFPNRRRSSPATKSFTLPKQAQLCCVSLQAQYLAFVRFAVESGTASAIALKRPLRSGTVDRRGYRASGFRPLLLRGQPATLNRCYGRNVVVPGVNSKRIFSFQ
jgi:hypothetical protein